ncbi:DUF3040 domain-containing protein [Pseudonocardia bannensis]|uniref:DUF3040 domain-containing protein n=1 Tax=Pseudonocardia bannensis TaxID=630973 RepID=A0A848DSM6_9PSEU|nr:DUF3040 domain-containing protein [Pseudonocardia bannensis]NMH95525.1 DUF3040 domain-containing protein [Pseudonocardia bannensis]
MTPPEPGPSRLTVAEQRQLEELERQFVVQFPELADALRDGRLPVLEPPERAAAFVTACILLVTAVLIGGLGLGGAVALSLAGAAAVGAGLRYWARRPIRQADPPDPPVGDGT